MFHFGVSNIRRLKAEASFDIKPITILVGRNSSGKSTFLRSLPLLKQSVTTRTNAPILWFGDFVDFGDFDNAVSDHARDKPIVFSFGINNIDINSENRFYDYRVHYHNMRGIRPPNVENIKTNISVVKFKDRTRVSRMEIFIEDYGIHYDISISDNQKIDTIKVNNKEINLHKESIEFSITPDTIVPYIKVISRGRMDVIKPSPDMIEGLMGVPSRDPFTLINSEIHKIVSEKINKKTSEENKHFFSSIIETIRPFNKKTIKVLYAVSSKPSWKNFLNLISSEQEEESFKRIEEISYITMLPSLTKCISNSVSSILKSLLYIGPARAKSDRYYRYQDLSVSEIDPNGTNFPMFLNSLPDHQLVKFSDWVKSIFGYGVAINKKQAGHISIELIYEKEVVNIIDTGYGVSQILPVLGQIWWSINRQQVRGRQFQKNTILSVEQPELHLHPAHQALLADAFISGVKLTDNDAEKNVSYIIETHSEALINRIGDLISDNKISETDVQILIFENDEYDSNKTKIRSAHFDENGILIDWPYGFFVPEIMG